MGPSAIHLDLDGAWPELPLSRIDAIAWGPQVRFSAPSRLIETLHAELRGKLAPFVVYGSGDFHHLSALWLRHITERFTLVSFDNHPDWDRRPPRWACGGWINRALELPNLRRAAVWGCGNFECWWPHQLFGNREAERSGRLQVHPWADGRSASDARRRGAILQTNWRDRFQIFARELRGTAVYITIDLDCLRADLAATNWENGRFSRADVTWALRTLRENARVVGADICGAYSKPVYARRKQRLAANWDHLKVELPSQAVIQERNRAAFDALWPALTE